MLSKNAKTVLKKAKKSEKKQISYIDLKESLDWEFEDARSACKQLIDAGLAYERNHSPLPGSCIPWGIVLTEKGRNSKKYFWGGIGEFLFKNVAVPIVVAFFTALITAYVTAVIMQG